MEVSLDVAHLIVLNGNWIPLDLLVLQRVSKSFYRAIKRLKPDYGILWNMKFICKYLTQDILDRILNSDMVIFGSLLLCAVLGRLDVQVFDVDVLSPSIEKEVIQRVFPRAKRVRFTGGNYIQVFQRWQDSKFDIPADIPLDGETPEEFTQRHIGKSDLPVQRILYGRNGFKCQRLSSFWDKTQECDDLCLAYKRCRRFMDRFEEYGVAGYVKISPTYELRKVLNTFPYAKLSVHDQETLRVIVEQPKAQQHLVKVSNDP